MAGAGGSGGRGLSELLTQLPTTALPTYCPAVPTTGTPQSLAGVPTIHGAAGPFPLVTLLLGIQCQAWQCWGLCEDLAKPEDEQDGAAWIAVLPPGCNSSTSPWPSNPHFHSTGGSATRSPKSGLGSWVGHSSALQ